MNKNKRIAAAKRAKWMAGFERAVLALDDSHAGKIKWDAAHYFWYQGLDPDQAATKYTQSRGDQ